MVLSGVIALVLVAAATYAFAGRQTADVAVPPDDATPEQVVAAFLDALDARDCDTAAALWATETADGGEPSWCGDVAPLDSIEIQDHSLESPADSGHDPGDQVAWVDVTFTLDWRAFGSDGSMPEGANDWGYLLVRSSPDDPWRITDQGHV